MFRGRYSDDIGKTPDKKKAKKKKKKIITEIKRMKKEKYKHRKEFTRILNKITWVYIILKCIIVFYTFSLALIRTVNVGLIMITVMITIKMMIMIL